MEPSRKEIRVFQVMILAWYEQNGRQFEWRKPGLSIYQIIVTEVLLQRTKAETVSRQYNQFLNRFPNWDSIIESSAEEIEQALTPFGLYKQRAKRLKGLALSIDGHGGNLPAGRSEIEAMPMMGQYIANAVELLIHSRKKPLLDVNMARVLERYFGPRKLTDIRHDPYLQALSQEVVNHTKSKELSWAILDFAALICQSRKPRCSICLFQQTCTYYLTINNIAAPLEFE